MLRVVLYDTNETEWIASAVIKIISEVDEGVPADALYAELKAPPCGEIARIKLYKDGAEVFAGVVDEQTRISGSTGHVLKISARSPAAYLLDNEAEPCAFDHPSAKLMAERYAKPFGLSVDTGDGAVCFGRQDVLKGASCYGVLKRFCAACYSGLPRISGTGTLSFKGMMRDGTARFGSADGEIRYTRLEERRRRCKEISEVRIKTSASGGYTASIKNSDALNRGVRRVRYLNAALTESPMKCAEAMIENGRKSAYSLRLICPECLLGYEGMNAEVDDQSVSEKSGLYISALRYRMTAGGEYTEVTLTRRNS